MGAMKHRVRFAPLPLTLLASFPGCRLRQPQQTKRELSPCRGREWKSLGTWTERCCLGGGGSRRAIRNSKGAKKHEATMNAPAAGVCRAGRFAATFVRSPLSCQLESCDSPLPRLPLQRDRGAEGGGDEEEAAEESRMNAENSEYRINRLNLLAFPRNNVPRCDITGERANVELVTPFVTL